MLPTQMVSKILINRSEERRVGKECRSRCDWSSDVCSSDLWLFEQRAATSVVVGLHSKGVGSYASDPDGFKNTHQLLQMDSIVNFLWASIVQSIFCTAA